MLPMWVLALPIWLVIFIVLYALATLYIAIKYREVRKLLAGAFFVSSGTCWYPWVTSDIPHSAWIALMIKMKSMNRSRV
jgi:hypothetical protein